jgi:hypothetical protein
MGHHREFLVENGHTITLMKLKLIVAISVLAAAPSDAWSARTFRQWREWLPAISDC